MQCEEEASKHTGVTLLTNHHLSIYRVKMRKLECLVVMNVQKKAPYQIQFASWMNKMIYFLYNICFDSIF